MSLSVGIVGLPNVGKSTLFNALLKKQQAYVANFPFATIEPNVGVVPVPDKRLKRLSQVVKESENLPSFPPEVPATVKFVDIAGLIAGANKGEGLGNKFLAHIREADAMCHVVRAFTDPDVVKQGVAHPKADFETVETELKLADLQTLEKQPSFAEASKGKKDPNDPVLLRAKVVDKLKEALGQGMTAREVVLTDEEKNSAQELSLLTAKPILVCINVDEEDLKDKDALEPRYAKDLGVNADQVAVICAKTEAELAGLSAQDQQDYLQSLGVEGSGLERLIQKAFATLSLITFLTAGEKEVRAWTIHSDDTALTASGVIHTDFTKKFIKADVVAIEDFVSLGGWKACRDVGKVRSEGREYVVKNGEVIEFKIGT